MKIGFYFGLAKDGIRKNKRMYKPYILTCIGMVMMYYIIMFLQTDEVIKHMSSGGNVQMILGFGGGIMAIFSCIFLFYTNSFLIRRRKKEFGLYNILGMGRRHISIVILFESIIVAVIALVVGILAGVLFSKFAELGLINMVQMKASFSFSVGIAAILSAVKVYSIIFVLLFLNNLRQLYFSSTIELLGSEKAGEKPLKANWFYAVAGVVILGIAYYIAVTIDNPLVAFSLFFIAVVLVIGATYLLMISGSVAFCKLLQKSKKYYYKKNHFVSVSSMAYRMKRNGAGLASICILATMVLVIISSTSCLYFGSEDSMRSSYPREINCTIYLEDGQALNDENIEVLKNGIDEIVNKKGVEVSNVYQTRNGSIAGALDGNKVSTSIGAFGDNGINQMSKVVLIYFIPIADYNRATGKNVELGKGEALVHYKDKLDDTLVVNDTTIKIKEQLDETPFTEETAFEIAPIMMVYINDYEETLGALTSLKSDEDKRLVYQYSYSFDTNLSPADQAKFAKKLAKKIEKKNYDYLELSVESREANRMDFYSTYGGLFYLGMLLSVVFVFAAVLIIYYKQTSEGYEDQARFEIMRKVGMTDKEIKGSINSQMVTVFFFPLILAGIHVCFAFPIIEKLLVMFNLHNVSLFVRTSVITFIIFGVLYGIVYKITSNAYYRIVRTNM